MASSSVQSNNGSATSRQRGRKPTFAPRNPPAIPQPRPEINNTTTTTNDENTPSSQSTLKKQLLGPSLLKSGQDNVDQSKVAEIIYEASKGSKYFANESRKDLELTKRISRILKKKADLLQPQNQDGLQKDLKRADEYITLLESQRDLTQTIVHVDCDAFYASVEELDRPELKKVPMAVGKGVLTTCNYEARKFGCRSGMAGHIALKLCPQLTFLPLNFAKYTAKAKEVRQVLTRYDERFEAASCDEAYLNITNYLEKHEMTAEEAVEKMRREVLEHAKITVSAGIAPNARIAKICSNKNKPNGQFCMLGDRATVMSFMKNLPVRKVNGIGRVFERELEAVGIKTCGDIYTIRGLLPKLFGQKAYEFLISAFLGLGRTEIRPAEEYIRKSIGSESTFKDCGGTTALRERLRKTAADLNEDLVKTELQGRTLALKIKLYTYEEAIRQKPLPYPIWKTDDLYDFALPLLTKLEEEYKPMKIRLMGLRLTNISSRKKVEAEGGGSFFKRVVTPGGKKRKFGSEEEEKWEEWPEEEFSKYDDAGFEIRADDNNNNNNDNYNCDERDEEEMKYFDGLNSDDFLALEGEGLKEVETPKEENVEEEEEEVLWPCPICGISQVPDDKTFNAHVDYCLSRQTIREAVREGDGEVKDTDKDKDMDKDGVSASTNIAITVSTVGGSPEKSTINAIFKEYRQGGSQKNPLPSKKGRPRGGGKRRKV
ncbi:hypothetical protein AA313_de0208185 [Arthrobotrys entomopaga]|nr:hypothetical protein AA313_de0208185 [Arthrobotrys entomopaga]